MNGPQDHIDYYPSKQKYIFKTFLRCLCFVCKTFCWSYILYIILYCWLSDTHKTHYVYKCFVQNILIVINTCSHNVLQKISDIHFIKMFWKCICVPPFVSHGTLCAQCNRQMQNTICRTQKFGLCLQNLKREMYWSYFTSISRLKNTNLVWLIHQQYEAVRKLAKNM